MKVKYTNPALRSATDQSNGSEVSILPSGEGTTSQQQLTPDPDGSVRKQTSNLATMMHILKGNVGTGILAMPSAFKNSGLLIGTIAVPFMGLIAISCMHMLVQCQEVLCSKLSIPFLEYEDIAETSFSQGPDRLRPYAKHVRRAVIVFVFIVQLGFGCAYSLFTAGSLSEITRNVFNVNISITGYLLILFPLMVLANQVKSLHRLAYFSSVANILQLSGMTYVLITLCQGLPATSTVASIAPLSTMPLFFGTAIYAFEGIAIVLPIKKDMREVEAFSGATGVLNTSMIIVAIMYIAMGFYGFLKYGDAVVGNIALSLPPGPANDVVRLMLALAIFLTYPLQMYVPFTISWPWMEDRFNLVKGSNKHTIADFSFRCLFIAGTFLVAGAVPKLDLFISLVGAFSSSCLALIFPPVLHLLVFWEGRDSMGRIMLIWWISKNAFITVFGLLGFVTGTYCALDAIIVHFRGL